MGFQQVTVLLLAFGVSALAQTEDEKLYLFPELTELVTQFHRHAPEGESTYTTCEKEKEELVRKVRHADVLKASCRHTQVSLWPPGQGTEVFGWIKLRLWLHGPIRREEVPFTPPIEKRGSGSLVNYRKTVESYRDQGEEDESYVFFTWDQKRDKGHVEKGTLWKLSHPHLLLPGQ